MNEVVFTMVEGDRPFITDPEYLIIVMSLFSDEQVEEISRMNGIVSFSFLCFQLSKLHGGNLIREESMKDFEDFKFCIILENVFLR